MPKRSTQALIAGIAEAPDEPIRQGAGVAGFAHKDTPPPANVSADVAAYDDLWRPVGVRVRGAELALLSTYAARERFKKGPLLTAVIQMLAAGEIDPDAIRARVRALRDADA